MKKLSVIFDRVLSSLAGIAAVLIGVACISVCVEIIARYFLNRPQAWVFETTEYILLWVTFLATAWVLRKEGHVRIDILVDQLNPRGQVLVSIITSIIGAIACLVVSWYGVRVAWTYYKQGIIIPKTLQLPQSPILAIIAVGSFLLFIQFLRRTYRYLGMWRESRDT